MTKADRQIGVLAATDVQGDSMSSAPGPQSFETIMANRWRQGSPRTPAPLNRNLDTFQIWGQNPVRQRLVREAPNQAGTDGRAEKKVTSRHGPNIQPRTCGNQGVESGIGVGKAMKERIRPRGDNHPGVLQGGDGVETLTDRRSAGLEHGRQ
jgi:hypothetical protein